MLENLLRDAAQARNTDDYQKAAAIYEHVAKICEEDQGQDENLAFCLQELVTIYTQEGLYDRLIPVYKKFIGLGSKILGENHPDVINTVVCLARALEANKQFVQADEIFKLAASRAERALGLSHPLAQEIRQEYFDLLSNREASEQDDTLKLGLVPLPAGKSESVPISQPSLEPSLPPTSPPIEAKGSVPIKRVAKQPKKIKTLRYSAESAQAKAADLLNIHVLRHRWRGLLHLTSVILGIAAITFALSKLLLPAHISAANLIGEQLIVKGLFQSADGNCGVQFIDNRFAMLTTDVQHRKIPYFLLTGNLSDIWAVLLSTVVTRESWYQFAGDELISEDGNVFYSNGSPEFLVTKKMCLFADIAKRYYDAHGCYPDKIEKLSATSGLTYINPFSGKAEMPLIKRANGNFGRDNIFSGVKPDASVIDCYNYLRSGGSWHEDPFPGKISALALYTSQRCADGYMVNEFYVHGYDRHSKLLTSGRPRTSYVIGFLGNKSLSNLASERMAEIEQVSVHIPRRIYIVPGDSTDLQFMHQLGNNLLTMLVVLSGSGWIFFRLYQRGRIQQTGMSSNAVDIIFGLSLIIWATSLIIHLLG